MADRPEDAVALSDADLEELAAEPSDHHLEPANRVDESEEPTRERPTRAKPRPQARRAEAQRAIRADDLEDTGSGKGTEDGTEEEPSEARKTGLEDEEPPLEELDPTDGLPAGQPAPAPPAAAEVKGKPFKFKASGAEHEFPGAVELADGSAHLTKEAANSFRQAMASTIEVRNRATAERREAQRIINRLKNERSSKEVEADLTAQVLGKVLALPDDDAVFNWATEFRANAPALKLQIKEAQLENDRKSFEREKQGPEMLPEEQEEEFTRTVQTELHSTFKRLLESPEAKHLPDADRKRLWDRWVNKAHTLVQLDGKQAIFDDSEVVDDFLYHVNLRKEQAKTLKAGRRNDELNADQAQTVDTPPPPVVRGGKPPARNGEEQRKKYGRGQRRQFGRDFMAGTLDSKDD